MRRVRASLSVVAAVLMTTGVFAQARPSMAGDWMAIGPDGRGDPGATMTIAQSATTMTLEYVGCDQRAATGKLTYTLDGSVSRNRTVGAGGGAPTDHVSRATWVGNRVVVTTTTASGDEKRTFSLEGDDLVVETSAPGRNGGAPNVARVTYTKYECGFGG